jgi:UDP-GlcNAc:undecaprenyl-phosphate GlcNAc-1-phosphate transferase
VDGGWWQYLGVFVGSVVLSLFLTPLAIRVATRRQVLDRPGDHKSHTSPVPYLGGVAIVVAFSAVVVAASIIDTSSSGTDELVKVLGVALGLAAMGLIDDLRKLPALVRLALEIGAGFLIVIFDLGVSFTGSPVFDAVVTVVWVVGLVNAFNMSDNMDGLSAGLATIAASSLFAVAAANGQYLVASLSAALAGCAIGFLRSNVYPARIYMGDAGAYFLGFMIAYLGLKVQFLSSPSNNTFLVPILVVSVVIFDTTLVTFTRLYHGISPLQAGKDHTSHRLVKVGLPIPVAVGLIHTAAVAVGMLAFVVARVDDASGWILAVFVGVVMVAFGSLLAVVPVYDSSRHPLYRFAKSADQVD